MSTVNATVSRQLFYTRRALTPPAPVAANSAQPPVTETASPSGTASATAAGSAATTKPAFYARSALNGGAVQQLAAAAVTAPTPSSSSTVAASGVTAANAAAAYQTAAQASSVTPVAPLASTTTAPAAPQAATGTASTTSTAPVQQAKAITDALPTTKTADGGYKAVQVSDSDAATLKAGAVTSPFAGDVSTHAPSGSVFGLPQSDAKPLSTQTFNFAFANGGRDVNNFALDLSGSGFDGSSLEGMLKSGALQISFQKWNGVGQVGNNAASLSLSGDRYSPTSFADGEFAGSSLNTRTNMNGSTIAGTFGGFSAKDGVTMTISSFSPAINVTGAGLTTY